MGRKPLLELLDGVAVKLKRLLVGWPSRKPTVVVRAEDFLPILGPHCWRIEASNAPATLAPRRFEKRGAGA